MKMDEMKVAKFKARIGKCFHVFPLPTSYYSDKSKLECLPRYWKCHLSLIDENEKISLEKEFVTMLTT
jgi:hypothetical protein